MIDPTQPLHLTGSPTLTGERCPQQTPLPACLAASLSPAVPKGMGLWHVQDNDQQHCTLKASDKESSQEDHLAPGLLRLWHCEPGDSSAVARSLRSCCCHSQEVRSGM